VIFSQKCRLIPMSDQMQIAGSNARHTHNSRTHNRPVSSLPAGWCATAQKKKKPTDLFFFLEHVF